jgi:hypothetical protein
MPLITLAAIVAGTVLQIKTVSMMKVELKPLEEI